MGQHLQRAEWLLERGRHREANQELLTSLECQEDEAAAHALLALSKARLGNHVEASNHAAESVRLAPDKALGHYALSIAMAGDQTVLSLPVIGPFCSDDTVKRAMESEIAEAIRLEPTNPEFFAQKANLHCVYAEWRACREAAERGLALDPHHFGCAIFRAEALLRIGNRTEARNTLERALAANPENASLHSGFGWALLLAGQRASASQCFLEAMRLDPHLPWAQEGLLECEKHRHWVYRALAALRLRLDGFHWSVRVIVICVCFFAFLGWMATHSTAGTGRPPDPAAAIGFWGFVAFLACIILYQHFFTWLARRSLAAQSSFAEQRKSELAKHGGMFGLVLGLTFAGVVIPTLTAKWAPAIFGLFPGLACCWFTFRAPKPSALSNWRLYSLALLPVVPVVAMLSRGWVGSLPMIVPWLGLFLPMIPVLLAMENDEPNKQP